MRSAKFAGSITEPAPALDELSAGSVFRDARHGVGPALIQELHPVPFGDKDTAVGSDQNVVRLIELVRWISRDTRRADGHQHLALRTELDDGMAFASGVENTMKFVRLSRPAVGDPRVALLVDEHSVGPEQQSLAEALHHLAVGV